MHEYSRLSEVRVWRSVQALETQQFSPVHHLHDICCRFFNCMIFRTPAPLKIVTLSLFRPPNRVSHALHV